MNKRTLVKFIIFVVVMTVAFTAMDYAFISYKGETQLVDATYQEMLTIDKINKLIIGLKIVISAIFSYLIFSNDK